MQETTITYSSVLITKTCGQCGIHFAVPETFDNARQRDGKTFYCPNGHLRVYRETESDRLKKELAFKQSQLERERATVQRLSDESATAERRLSAAKGQITKIKNRVSKGVCPCCNRQFADLHRHMTTQHPNYVTTGEVG